MNPAFASFVRCVVTSAVIVLASGAAQGAGATSLACSNGTTVLLVVGAPGEAEYGSNFVQQAVTWQQACSRTGCRCLTIGTEPAGSTNDLTLLQATLQAEQRTKLDQLWIVLIGHGTFDGKEARFNLRGPDLSATELASCLKPFTCPLTIVDTSASSAPFLNKLSATNRVVITATRSGNEQNYTRFGQYFAEALTDPSADYDKDGQISLLEAFLAASRRANEFYKTQGRIITEHALLDDNGDGMGTPADWFKGLRATRRPKENAGLDGLVARQLCLVLNERDRQLNPALRARRDALEREVFALREKKSEISEEEYFRKLETILIELARLHLTNSSAPNLN